MLNFFEQITQHVFLEPLKVDSVQHDTISHSTAMLLEEEDDQSIWPTWAVGVLLGCQMSKHTIPDVSLRGLSGGTPTPQH
jgi:hypothetical protein